MKLLKKYRTFIGNNEFFRAFIPNYEEMHGEEDDEPVEPYSFVCSPRYISHEMRDYQIEGLNWLINMHENSISCILADEMGLGKTLQTIALLGYIRYIKNENKRHLIVLPKSTLNNWKREFKKFMPSYKAKIFYASKKELKREASKLLSSKWDVCLTTYEMCINAKNFLCVVNWCYIVIDEAHRIKNEHSLLSRIVRIFSCDHRLLITGTPLQNNIHELWVLLNFIVPDIFNDAKKFEDYVLSIDGESGEGVGKLRSVLQLFFLRREKADVERTLLPKKVINVYAKLSMMQREWYKMLLKRDLSPLGSSRDPKGMLMNVVMQLRKCCNHPYLFPDAEPKPYTNDRHIIENSGKMVVLDKLLVNLRAKGSRVLIFSQMSMMLDILEDYVTLKDYEYCRIDGSTSYEDRIEAIDAFNCEGSDKFIFLLTTRAGGLGINLCTADTVILFDADWNPRMDLQAQDRAHRIGQKKQVVVFRMITENTVEERIVYRALQKLKLDEILVQGKKNRSSALSQAELVDIIASGMDPNEDSKEDVNIEDIIRRGEEKTKEMNDRLEEFKISDNQNNSLDLYVWEGEDYNLKRIEGFMEDVHNQEGRPSRMNVLFRAPRPKIPVLPEYQFHPKELRELLEKETKMYEEEGQALPPEDEARKKELLSQGFDWTKKDFQAYIRALEEVGKNDVEKIAALLMHKNDVARYHKVFWERIDELSDAERIKKSMHRYQARRERRHRMEKIIESKIDEMDSERLRTRFNDCNKFLLRTYKKHFNRTDWLDCVRRDILSSRNHQFNYYLLSRTSADLSKHINQLTSILVRSNGEPKRPA